MYLGIDLGTSGVKALLIDLDMAIVAQATRPLTVRQPHPLWSEQEPADWIAATADAIDALREEAPVAVSALCGIGLSGQMHGAVALDAADAVLRPAILWNDGRSHVEASALDADPRVRAITGNIVFPGFTAPKLAWMRQHEPALFERVAKVLLPKDYLRLWLTGEHVSDMSDAAGTAWLDMTRRDWSDTLLAMTDLSRAQMPRLVEGTEVSGGLRPDLAQRWGVRAGLPVAGGAGDNAATAVGMGVVEEGDGFVSLGTSGVLFVANGSYRPRPESAVHAFCHALPQTWHQMGVMLSATAALEWYAGILGEPAPTLTAALGDTLRPPSRVMFQPYLSGERTPHNDPHLTAGFSGLTHGSDRNDLTYAVLEGVAFGLRDTLDALCAAGSLPESLIAVGGGSNSIYWLKLVATVLGLPLHVPAAGEVGAAFGAARLAMIATEGRADQGHMAKPDIEMVVESESDLVALYGDRHAAWRKKISGGSI